MSATIEAILSHALTSFEEVERLPNRLRGLAGVAASLDRRYWGSAEPAPAAAWYVKTFGSPSNQGSPRQEWEAGEGPTLSCSERPGDFPVGTIVFGRRCLFVTTSIKWGVAIEDLSLLRAVRDYAYELVLALGSEAFLLHPDNGGLSWDWVFRGMTLGEIERECAWQGVSPVLDLAELQRQHPFRKAGRTTYYRESVSEPSLGM